MHAHERYAEGMLQILARDLLAQAAEVDRLLGASDEGYFSRDDVDATIGRLADTTEHLRKRLASAWRTQQPRPMPPLSTVTYPDKEAKNG